MTEGLFILTTIFVAYVVYVVIDEQKATTKSNAPTAKPEAKATAIEQPKPETAVIKEKPAETKTVVPKAAATKSVTTKAAATKTTAPKGTVKTSTAKTAATKAAAAKKTTAATPKANGLKNPKTGEVATTYGNYRFTKRWIKDALVEEGLLEKIYTASQLNAETEAKIKEAIAKLEAMDKYKA
ncbi:hypothetical protein [Candidatus Methylobacter oryzae]|uniref:Uncharacterized protein n=1 Tax=Candidatus Methylobacter oryzae TaxID=2497749 RepID=A0ABY3C7V4_9GAMM|nr:hypothetical protein [Candidatus Methylobacter oryzae]TRW92176.1 hypothetical protein EKO24_015200 [Candidatus Methylobacter oryzae]